jgi:hypothetical protein
MKHLRLKASIHLNREHAIPKETLESLKSQIQHAIASCIPDGINIDTIKVTSLKEVTSREINEDGKE